MTGFGVYTEDQSPEQTWQVTGSTALAHLIERECRVSQADSERLAALAANRGSVRFETSVSLASSLLSKKPCKSASTAWLAMQAMTGGPGGGRFHLTMWKIKEER